MLRILAFGMATVALAVASFSLQDEGWVFFVCVIATIVMFCNTVVSFILHKRELKNTETASVVMMDKGSFVKEPRIMGKRPPL